MGIYVMEDYQRNKYIFGEKLPQIEEIRNTFKSLYDEFVQYENNFSDPLKISPKLWYFFHIKQRIKKKYNASSEVYIWGTGKYGVVVKEMLDAFLPEVDISGYLDSDREDCFLEYKVYKPDEVIKRKNVIVFVAAFNGQGEIVESLKNADKVFNRDYFILAPRSW